MIISEEVLLRWGAVSKKYETGEPIFNEGGEPKFYKQIKTGLVKICNTFENGKEFVHGFPFEGHCIGESYLFTDIEYSINAVCVAPCEILKLSKVSFHQMISENPLLHFKISNYTAERINFRYKISSLLCVPDPVQRIIVLLDHIKTYFGFKGKFSFQIPYTRQQLSSLIGLRVETVIRSLKIMEKSKIVKFEGSKIFY